jgi:hypothetical protein
MDTVHGPWLDQPLAAAFLGFNLLPVDWMHPSRSASWNVDEACRAKLAACGALASADPRALRRHASAILVNSRGPDETVILGLRDPALPVFMACEASFERLLLGCGLVLLGPSIRRIITREDLQALRAELTREELDFARGPASRLLPPGGSEGVTVSLGHTREQACGLGYAVLAVVAEHACPPVACRARLRLPSIPESSPIELPVSLRDGASALAFARGVLLEVDPEWLSLFPAFH